MIPHKVKLYFDGSCGPKNPGGIAGYFWRILDSDNQLIAEKGEEVCRGPAATNNIGEWAGVTSGLNYLAEQNWTGHVDIYGDSQLVIRQLNGVYKVKKETLKPYHDSCKKLLSNMTWTATWISREENKECDLNSRYF